MHAAPPAGPSKTLPSSDVIALRAGPDVPLSAQVGHCLRARERHRGRRLYDDSFSPGRCDRVAVSLRSQASNCADDLISDTRGGTGFNAIDPKTNQPLNDACFASGWNKELTQRVLTQMAAANLSSESATVGYCCRDLRVDRCCEQCSRRTGRTPATRAGLTTTTTMTRRTAWRCSGAARPSSTL